MLHFVVGTFMYGYNRVEHRVTGADNCTGINYCKVLIQVYLFRHLLTMSTQEAAVIALKTRGGELGGQRGQLHFHFERWGQSPSTFYCLTGCY